MNDYFTRPRIDRLQKTKTKVRQDFRESLDKNEVIRFFGVTSPIEAIILQEQAARLGVKAGCYISGAGTSTFFGLPDIGLLTLEELVLATRNITQVTDLPVLVDIDTGYGDVGKTVQSLESVGATILHMEDQEFPKRCGHLDGKSVISEEKMCERIRDARKAQKDESLMIMARSDALLIEGFEQMVSRLQSYGEAGAEALFPEAITSLEQFDALGKRLSKPYLANLTENGKTPLGLEGQLSKKGCQIFLYPVTFLRAQMQLVESTIEEIVENGNLDLQEKVMTRSKSMHYLCYDDYVAQDKNLAGHGIMIDPKENRGKTGND